MVRRTGIPITFILFLLFSAAMSQVRTPLTVITYNIRLDVPSDGVNAWPNRKELLAGLIRFHAPDVVGLQEAQIHQLKFLAEALPEYAWLGVGRDDGKEAGEFMAILYRKERIAPVHSSTFWCSPTPSAPGLGWDASFNRIVTWGTFRDTLSKQTFLLFNTHLDHVGVTARRESAKLLMDSVRAVSGSDPVIITGDFNSRPADEPYQTVIAPKAQRTFRDTRTISRQPQYGPEGTFNGFNGAEYATEPIDYIFVSEGTEVLSHATLTDSFHGRFPSDHFPIITTILLGRTPKRAR